MFRPEYIGTLRVVPEAASSAGNSTSTPVPRREKANSATGRSSTRAIQVSASMKTRQPPRLIGPVRMKSNNLVGPQTLRKRTDSRKSGSRATINGLWGSCKIASRAAGTRNRRRQSARNAVNERIGLESSIEARTASSLANSNGDSGSGLKPLMASHPLRNSSLSMPSLRSGVVPL
jgi:hypothetical protein